MADMNKIEVKNKLKTIIGELLVRDLESGRALPDRVCDYMLGNHGLTTSYSSENDANDLEDFITSLTKWIEDWNLLQPANTETLEVDSDLGGVYKDYAEAEAEYEEVTSELVKTLKEAIHQKEEFSEHFNSKCKSQESKMNVLVAKTEFSKLQFYLKLYGEENALAGHIALESKLKKELDFLIKSYKELEETNKQYDKIKNDASFCELFKTYKELKKIEKRAEIIGSM